MAGHRAVRVLLVATAASLAGTGIAYAYWSTAAAGSGAASTGTMTINAAALTGETAQNTLYPGGTADAVVKVNNPNGYPVQVIAIAATGPAQAANNCAPTGIVFTAPTDFSAAQFTLPPSQSTVLDLAGAVSMDTTSATTCQGQSFSLPVTVTVRK
ncbi:hypothetical protein BCF44_113222 [Kutzneria buriramensis]|uniref:Ribosomally synthesized peptide with SipW-like signal peptide n=2 Tax=Kutzneria buriramensis TaxID=1045776 RepID=A0A3E0H7V7_9PSEU|nr:hypothetical protein BCF44_113222 [Kutzneria buriramensis]